jgi:hypothetical protein
MPTYATIEELNDVKNNLLAVLAQLSTRADLGT